MSLRLLSAPEDCATDYYERLYRESVRTTNKCAIGVESLGTGYQGYSN